MIPQKLNYWTYIIAYRLKSRASEIVIEDYDDTLDAILSVTIAVLMAIIFGSSMQYAIYDSVPLLLGLAALLATSVYLVTVHAIAFWYYMSEPTEVEPEWVVIDG